ncbi:hypothetical protein BCR39DRAFT_562840 [Naematelia encephala]|uniref:Uncharacterized protein n=1 Tax=Naematelia encephala TaxID=71784 RepID=A0A1Y2AEA2_9TREE|nr:hypothetical protein BCR39DRAFT_562840 [Naematelia encephala]
MERVQLRRNYSNKPYVREGRGGGGWEVHEKHLLSNKEQPLVEVLVDGKKRLRRDLDVDLECVRGPELEDDLIKLGLMRDPNIRSPSPPPPVKPVVKRPTPYAPSPVQPRENYTVPKNRANINLGLGPSLRTYVRFEPPRQQSSPIASSTQPPSLPVASSSRPSPIQVASSSRSATPAGRVAGDAYDHARDRPYDRHLPPISGSAGSHVTSQMFPEATEGRYRTDSRLPPPKREPWTPSFPGMPGDYLYSLNPRY